MKGHCTPLQVRTSFQIVFSLPGAHLPAQHLRVAGGHCQRVAHACLPVRARKLHLVIPARAAVLQVSPVEEALYEAAQGTACYTCRVERLSGSNALWLLQRARAHRVPQCGHSKEHTVSSRKCGILVSSICVSPCSNTGDTFAAHAQHLFTTSSAAAAEQLTFW